MSSLDDSAITLIDIPFICDLAHEYDTLGFDAYPVRMGWASPSDPLKWLDCPDDELAVRAQVWLYFGVVSEFCGEVVPIAAFHNDCGPCPRVSTANLLDLLEKKRMVLVKKTSRSSLEAKESFDRFRHCLKEATRCSELLEQQISIPDGLLGLISCSIRLLLQALGSAFYFHSSSSTFGKTVQRSGKRWKVPPAKLIQNRMIESGWCPSQIHYLSQEYSCATLHYLSGISRRATNHYNHHQCTTSACTASNVDENTYQTKHTDACNDSSCSFDGFDSADVSSVIENNADIPLITCSISADGKVKTELVPAGPGIEYVAISHVWAGGLGNPHHNALPECQLARLMQLVRTLEVTVSKIVNFRGLIHSHKPVYFWIDTLCVPVGNRFKAARKIAIGTMAKIYAGATTVLVLDPELLYIMHRGLPITRLLAHVLYSAWMSRCWTLQEASLSKSWYVQFADGVFNVESAMRLSRVSASSLKYINRHKTIQETAQQELLNELSSFLVEMGELRWQRADRVAMWSTKGLEEQQAKSFAATWNNFLGRTTTRTSDLHQIMAAMQDFKFETIQPLDMIARMKAILKGHACLPLALLFSPSTKLQDHSNTNGWAPEFPQGDRLDCSLGYMRVFTDCLFIPPKLMFERLTICILPPEAVLVEGFRIMTGSGGDQEQLWIEMEPTFSQQQRQRGNRSACIVFTNTSHGPDISDWNQSRGARFLLRQREDNALHLVYDRPFRIYGYDRSRVKLRSQQIDRPVYQLISTELIAPGTRIFVDCALQSWPSADHFYDSPEGPLFNQPTGHIYFTAYVMVEGTWTVSFIVVMASASVLHLSRLPLFYCYIGKITTAVIEVFWWRRIWQAAELQAWSENSGVHGRDALRYYDILNRNPSIFFGPCRIGLMLGVSIVFICLGSLHLSHNARWALWPGTLLLLEVALRCIFHICWLNLPQTATGTRAREKLHRRWPKFRAWMMRRREMGVHENLDRVPFSEDEITETWYTSAASPFSAEAWRVALKDRLGFKPRVSRYRK